MPSVNSTTNSSVAAFWNRYLELLEKRRVKETSRHWFVRGAEAFIRAAKGKKLAEHTPADINRYLEEQGRKDGITDWQFRQIVDAIQILLETAGAGCVSAGGHRGPGWPVRRPVRFPGAAHG